MTATVRDIATLVKRETGIVIRDPQLPALEAVMLRIEPRMDAAAFLSEATDPAGGPKLVARLVDEVTIKETYFFRERRELDAIDWHRLFELAQAAGSQSVRIWVAACATGEEAYSLAMLASEALGHVKVPLTVLATDISADALRRAERGRYSKRSMQNVDAELRERYFTRDGRHHLVGERLRSLVRFRRHNLIQDPAPPLGEGAFDLITCRNVMIYFDPPTVEGVIGGLEGALRPQAQLILGAADRLIGTSDRLTRLNTGAATTAERRRRRPTDGRALRRPLGLAKPKDEPEVARASSAPAPNGPRRRRDDQIEDALRAADSGDIEEALAKVSEVLAVDPLDSDAYFVRGLAELGRGDPATAAATLRRALYVDPSFGLAAFQLGRAHDAAGDRRAARRAYEQALRVLDPADTRHRAILGQVDLGEIAEACRTRLNRQAS
jgi:chemotaxis protein methyltransferase CheR